MIRLIQNRVALEAPLDAARARERLVWASRARALVADSLEQYRAGPRFDFYLGLPHQMGPRGR